jgi:hypothetical protein
MPECRFNKSTTPSKPPTNDQNRPPAIKKGLESLGPKGLYVMLEFQWPNATRLRSQQIRLGMSGVGVGSRVGVQTRLNGAVLEGLGSPPLSRALARTTTASWLASSDLR